MSWFLLLPEMLKPSAPFSICSNLQGLIRNPCSSAPFPSPSSPVNCYTYSKCQLICPPQGSLPACTAWTRSPITLFSIYLSVVTSHPSPWDLTCLCPCRSQCWDTGQACWARHSEPWHELQHMLNKFWWLIKQSKITFQFPLQVTVLP